MSQVLRRNRKGSDADILRLNGVGLSLATVAKSFDCHPSSISQRLKSLNVPVADTRKSFMEEVFLSLEPDAQEWLADLMTPPDGSPSTTNLRKFVSSLITDAQKVAAP